MPLMAPLLHAGCMAALLLPRAAEPLTRRTAVIGTTLAVLQSTQTSPAHALADKVGPDGRLVLTDTTAASIDVTATPPRCTSRCFLDVSIGGTPAGRIVVDLFGDVAPRAAENFRALCTGEKGYGYAGSTFYRVVSNFTLQGGEIEGQGSIYGPTFPHDNYFIKHNVAGLVSMVNSGKGGNSGTSDSRFLIQLPDDAGFLDGRYEAFGIVTAGMDVVRKIEGVSVVQPKNYPVQKVRIDNSGELKQ
ncbi:hypothetical protein AB1Y20_022877 [Prymnesium parvum]|uniref:Peptidyl-prolyl cis-trans isomerase n=1 Tax=Prymnesium parvum TaxID=97485 RepID=A0AB34JCH8_PRYPA|mmetsp:Transcript_44063/g.107075  ORF Transcript_44063/g.107075 Transcript_44063/m.107075 type:complete len:246 (+) Transcript_44063:3-740(+)